MVKFSERYGYVKPSSVLIREKITDDIVNAICTAYDLLAKDMEYYGQYQEMEEHLWCYFLNKRINDFYKGGEYYSVATLYIKSDIQWYKKLDLIEETIYHFTSKGDTIYKYNEWLDFFIDYLNIEFARLNFAYRVIDSQIVEVTSEEEIVTVEKALQNSSNGVKEHLQTALKLLSKRPEGDYRNSIKESISAVECMVREITGENTLNLAKLEKNGIILPSVLKKSFDLLYGYTNDKSTGIRHALMDDTNSPGVDEAIYMLVSCSAFINYLTKKKK